MPHHPDIEEQLGWERRARTLLQWASVAVARAGSVDEMLESAVNEICRITGWPVGHVYHCVEDGVLASSGIWHLQDGARYGAFRAVTAGMRFPAGVGLPGRVLAEKRPLWISDISGDANFPRAHTAPPGVDIGVRAAFAFPVRLRDEVVAVLEFAAGEVMVPDQPLLEVMGALGTQLGWGIERARADSSLRASEQRLRLLAETANDAIITADADGAIASWNGAAQRMFGYAEHEVVGWPLSQLMPERYRARHEAGMARVRDQGERRVIGRTVELEALSRAGREFPVELSLATWTVNGRSWYTGIIRDISERKEAERRARELAARMEASERAAVEASRAKSLFLANMNHELRTPLNAILGFVGLLERDGNLTARQRESLGIVSRSGEHLLGLINDVLSIAKIEAGEAEAQSAVFDLGQMVDGLRGLFALRAEARGLALEVHHPGAPQAVRGDEGKLRQVLINLLGNAIKFTARGQVALRVTRAGERVRFAVEDTGPGISPEEQARLFEPFTQTATGRQVQEGTGLGLAISRDFVRLMGGELQVASVEGRGTTFCFEIPLPPAPDDAGTDAAPRRRVVGLDLPPGAAAPRVLVVDNADDNRRLLATLLALAGFDVREACDGRQAIAAWEEFRPALVYMDMQMPVLDGYEATRAIRAAERAHGPRPRTRIVALTASAFDHDRPEILAAGCDEVMVKPFREEALFQGIADSLGVRYRFEPLDGGGTPDDTAGGLSVQELRAVPPAARAALRRALSDGDDLGAHRRLDEIEADHPRLCAVLRAQVQRFAFDQLLALLEQAG